MSRLLVRTAPVPAGLTVAGHRSARSSALRGALAEVGLRLDPDDVELERRCPTCGGTDHGKPEVPAARAAGWHVSIAHTAARLAVAVADSPCGVDVEDVAAVARAPVAAVLLASAEREPARRAPAAAGLARTWVRKEALLKATGHGLAVDLALLVLDGPGMAPRLLRWDGPGPPPRPVSWFEDTLPPGHAEPAGAMVSAVALHAP